MSLSEAQAKVLLFVRARVEEAGQFPAKREIREHMGWKSNAGVYDVLYRLRNRGLLKLVKVRAPGSTRIVQVWSITEKGWG